MTDLNSIYAELWQNSDIKDFPTYPDTCPLCGATIAEDKRDYYKGPIYKCRGQYTFKDQIQAHTDKWWGSCPVRYQEGLESKELLDGITIWLVRENGQHKHIATFSDTTLAENYARQLSNDYPPFWDHGCSKVDYIEILGSVGFGDQGLRYRKGEMIAKKSIPRHIKKSGHKQVWFDVEQVHLGRYKYGKIL